MINKKKKKKKKSRTSWSIKHSLQTTQTVWAVEAAQSFHTHKNTGITAGTISAHSRLHYHLQKKQIPFQVKLWKPSENKGSFSYKIQMCHKGEILWPEVYFPWIFFVIV